MQFRLMHIPKCWSTWSWGTASYKMLSGKAKYPWCENMVSFLNVWMPLEWTSIKRQPAVERCVTIVNGTAWELFQNLTFWTCCFLHLRCLHVEEGETTICELAESLSTKRWFFFSCMWKKQCKYCNFYSLCKHPDVMQAELDFSSHHYSLYLAIHAQTFVHLEIYCWFFIKKQIFFRSVRGLGVTAWPGGHQNPFVICKVVFWVYLYMCPLLSNFTLAIQHIWACAGGEDDPIESDMLNWITVPCPRGTSAGWVHDDGWKWHGIF